jgi:regulator of protease activity HflC (stomatin/prohibitin superfamily)
MRNAYSQSTNEAIGLAMIGGLVFIGFFILSIIFGSWYVVDPTERGVIIRWGNIVGVAEPGLHGKLPWITSVPRVSMEDQTYAVDGLEAGSADQQAAVMRVSVTYRPNPEKVIEIWQRFQGVEGAVDRILKPRLQSRVKVAFGQFTAARTFGERAKLNEAVLNDLQTNVGDILIIDGVQIENVEFDKAYTDSISARMVEEVQVAKKQQELLKEQISAKIANTQADAEAYKVAAAGKAEADAIKLRGDAEASAIKAKSEALANNPNLVNLTWAQNTKGEVPHTVIIGNGSGVIPYLPLMQGAK